MTQTNQTEAARWLTKSQLGPPFRVPDSRIAWENQRTEVRSRLRQLLGKLPARPRIPDVKTLYCEDRGDYLLEKFEFDNESGATVPGYLLLPKERMNKAPGILYCHWHGGEYEMGKDELFQTRHTPEAPGPALARRGYVVLGVDAYCFGERDGRGPGGPAEKGGAGEMTASKFNLWVGRTLWGMILRDDLIALDYLSSRTEVDATQLGVTGMSMGATRAWWLMALEERIKTGVAVCCLTRYQNLIEHENLKAHGIYYFVPNLLNYFDTEAIVALLAPRPILFLDGDRDSTSPVDGIHAIESVVLAAYRLYGKESEFESIVYPNQGHVYTPEMWHRTLSWLGKSSGTRANHGLDPRVKSLGITVFAAGLLCQEIQAVGLPPAPRLGSWGQTVKKSGTTTDYIWDQNDLSSYIEALRETHQNFIIFDINTKRDWAELSEKLLPQLVGTDIQVVAAMESPHLNQYAWEDRWFPGLVAPMACTRTHVGPERWKCDHDVIVQWHKAWVDAATACSELSRSYPNLMGFAINDFDSYVESPEFPSALVGNRLTLDAIQAIADAAHSRNLGFKFMPVVYYGDPTVGEGYILGANYGVQLFSGEEMYVAVTFDVSGTHLSATLEFFHTDTIKDSNTTDVYKEVFVNVLDPAHRVQSESVATDQAIQRFQGDIGSRPYRNPSPNVRSPRQFARK